MKVKEEIERHQKKRSWIKKKGSKERNKKRKDKRIV